MKPTIHGLGRVSEGGEYLSLDRQRELFEIWCQSADKEREYPNHKIGDWYEDAFVSGRTIAFEDRPAVKRLLRNVYPGDIIWVAKIDRLRRDLRDNLNMWSKFKDHQVGLYVAQVGRDVTQGTADDKMLYAMLAALAEREGVQIIERTQAGHKAVEEVGGWTRGDPPIGWKTKKRYVHKLRKRVSFLEPNEEEREMCRRAAELYKEHGNYSKVGRILFQEGYRLLRGKSGRVHGPNRRKTGKRTSNGMLGHSRVKYLIELHETGFPKPGQILETLNSKGGNASQQHARTNLAELLSRS